MPNYVSSCFHSIEKRHLDTVLLYRPPTKKFKYWKINVKSLNLSKIGTYGAYVRACYSSTKYYYITVYMSNSPITIILLPLLLLYVYYYFYYYRGPLVVCLGLSVVLSFKAPTNQASLVFAAVFTGIWLGSSIVTLNAQLLGSTISFFQSLCVLGYCVFPLMLAAIIIGLLKLIPFSWISWLDFIFIAIGFLWATRASSVFFGLYISREKRALAVFPVFFFYTFLGWLILLF